MKTFTLLRTLLLLALIGLVAPATWAQVVRVKDIHSIGNLSSNPDGMTNVNGTLFFIATVPGETGTELYKSDGTEEGTVLVKDIAYGGSSSEPHWLTNVNGTLFFSADDGSNGRQLWKSDGTEAGTVLVKVFDSESLQGDPAQLTNVNGTLYFSALTNFEGRELWKSDGTTGGTVMVKDINDIDFQVGSNPGWLTNVNGTLFFAATTGLGKSELWKSDGTSGGTVMVKDITNYENGGSDPAYLTNVNGTLFFSANDLVNGTELWKSDGTEQGTVMVKDIWPGSEGSSPANLISYNGTLYFVADNGVNGAELWKSDGTAQGTVMVKDLGNGFSAFPYALTIMNGKLYFFANNATCGIDLWQTDGTSAGTKLVYTFENYSDGGIPKVLVASGNQLYFFAYEPVNGTELWQSDGTTVGTKLAKDINPGSASSYPNRLTDVNGTLFFAAEDGYGRELWKATLVPPCDARVALYPATPGRLCRGQDLLISFTTMGSCPQPPANTFLVQLSNATGSFANPTVLGYANVTTPTYPNPAQFVFPANLFANLPSGTGYRIRIVTPGHTSFPSYPFRLEDPTLSVTPGVTGAPVCRGGQVSVSFQLPAGSCPFPQGNVFTAQLSSSTGSFANPVSLGPVQAGVANSVTIPVGSAAGTGYRIRIVSSSPALTSSASAPLRVNAVGCTNRMSAEEPNLVVVPNPVVGGEIRLRVSGLDNPAFGLTTGTGRSMGVSVKTDGSGEFVLTPRQRLAPGVYLLQASEGQTRLTTRVLVTE